MLYRRILITGANGLVGQQLVRLMGGMPGYDVLASSRDEEPRFSGGSCGYTQLDVTDNSAITLLFDDFAPDVVINCAAMTQVDKCESKREECWQVNALAVDSLARSCLSSGARLIQISTDFVFDGKNGPYKEGVRPNPKSYYGRSKLAGENYTRGAGMNKWAIIRTVLVYGAAENLSRPNFVIWLRDKLSAGDIVNIVTDQWRTPTYAPDLAAGIEKVVRRGKKGVYHISGRELFSIHEFALVIARTLDLDESLIHRADAHSFSQAAARPSKSGFIILKAVTELGYDPKSTSDSIQDMVRHLEKDNTPS